MKLKEVLHLYVYANHTKSRK